MGEFSGKYLPVHLRPKQGEILSSWIVRLARANGYVLHTLTSILFPWKSLWNTDIDNSVDDKILRTLGDRTGADFHTCLLTALRSYEGFLFDRHTAQKTCPWVMNIDIYHRLRKKCGLQFCPDCLKEEEPFYRKKWRIALATICTKHKRYLLDKCPDCQSPVNFHRLNLNYESLCLCYYCKRDLSNVLVCEPVTDIDLEIQAGIFKTLDRGWKEVCEGTIVYSPLYFCVVHQMCKSIMRLKRQGMQIRMPEVLDNLNLLEMPRSCTVEELPAMARAALFRIVFWLLSEWPRRFLHFCNENRIYSSCLNKDFRYIPYWFEKVVKLNLYKPSYVPTDREIMCAIDYYKSRGLGFSARKISKIIGVRDVLRKRAHLRHLFK